MLWAAKERLSFYREMGISLRLARIQIILLCDWAKDEAAVDAWKDQLVVECDRKTKAIGF